MRGSTVYNYENISTIYTHLNYELTVLHQAVMCSIIESVDSISRDERDVPLTQYITNA